MAILDNTIVNGNAVVNGNIIATKIQKTGGTSTQYLRADGSTGSVVTSVNGNTGAVSVVTSFNGSTGAVTFSHSTQFGLWGGNYTTSSTLFTNLTGGNTGTFFLVPHNDSCLYIYDNTTLKYLGGGPICIRLSGSTVSLYVATNASGGYSNVSISSSNCKVNKCSVYSFY